MGIKVSFIEISQLVRFDTGEIDGSLGNAILRRFRVVFDYSRKQMILEPASKK